MSSTSSPQRSSSISSSIHPDASAGPSQPPHPCFRLIRAADLALNLPSSLPAPIPPALSPACIRSKSESRSTSRTRTRTHTLFLFLSGYISPPTEPPTPSWQSSLGASLRHLPLTVFDPARPDWDDSWVNSATFPPLNQQINWELEGLENADIVVVNFGPGTTDAPISLLEFGLVVGMGRDPGAGRRGAVVVWCEEGYRKGANVRVLCERYGVKVWEGEDGVRGEVERLVEEMVWGEELGE